MIIHFNVPGRPVPKERPRVTKYSTYTPKSTSDFQRRISAAYKALGCGPFPAGVPLSVTVAAHFQTPKSLSGKKRAALEGRPHIKRGDLDNVVKAVLDALNGSAFPDDSAVYHITATKDYREDPGVDITIFTKAENCNEKNIMY